MVKKVEVKVLELEANKLKAGSKYIFVMETSVVTEGDEEDIIEELSRLLGDNFTFLVLDDISKLKVYSVEDK